jgi:hypothetical protein
MSQMNQKNAVFAALCGVFGVTSFEEACQPTKEQRASVNQILFEGFREGKIELDSSKQYDDAKLKAYVSGLQSNWLRKDPRLNGNVKYEAKNPGSRAGSKDESIAAMRLLLATKTDKTERAEIQAFIDKRVAELRPAAVKKELTADQIALLKASGLEHLVG